ncbi:MAG: diaminopimelate decarboxylase [Chitinophagaceae bacterium]|nr:MAG: diaminopimelate decarboxylase [Chitinophagaceae bacterium]
MHPVLSPTTLLNIANEYGTPLYLYDANCIRHQYKLLADTFRRNDTHIFYACKALTNINILRIILKMGGGIDCVSINEVKLAIKAGFEPNQIIFTPNSVSLDEYIEATDLHLNINIDNLSILEAFGNHFGGGYPVIIRLNPHIMAGGNIKISTGHVDSKFGISIEQGEEIKSIVSATGIQIKGLHIHTGSEIKDIDVYIKGLELILELAKEFPTVSIIDLGGGFKVPYKKDEQGTNMEALGEKVAEAFSRYEVETGKTFQLWFEPGKFLVSECGYFLVKANVLKHSPTRSFVGVNSGFNHLIRPMFYDAYHFITNLSNSQGELKTYNVVGNICETDTFAWDRELNEVRPNDILLFNNAGAYGFEMSSRFNSRLRPAEVLVDGEEHKLIRRRETFDDIIEGMIF